MQIFFPHRQIAAVDLIFKVPRPYVANDYRGTIVAPVQELPKITQRSDQDPAEQKKYRRSKCLEDDPVSAAEDRFPQIHSGSVRRANADKQNWQPNDDDRYPC